MLRRTIALPALAAAAAVSLLLSAPRDAEAGAPKSRSAAARISLELHNTDLHNVFVILAGVSRLNFVVAEEVSGRVTLQLRNVAWSDALDAVLRLKSLGMEQSGNIVRIAPLKQLAEEQAARASMEKSAADTRPLKVRIVPVSYARAEDLVAQVKATLSERGSVTVDARTNSLVIRDVSD